MTEPRQGTPDGTWCAIPVYNNAATAAAVARACRRVLDRVVVVDDGSTDGDLRAALADTDVVVLRHPQRRGKGAALRTALAHVADQGARWLITLDGDGQHLPADIPRFFPRMAAEPDALLVGRRDMSGADVPGSSRFGRVFSNLWVFAETGRYLPDTQSGFRAYPVPRIAELPLASEHFDFEIEVLVRHAWAGGATGSVPVNAYYPPAGERVSHFDKWRDNARLSLLHTRLVGSRIGALVRAPWRAAMRSLRGGGPRAAAAAHAATAEGRPPAPRAIQPRRRGTRLGFWCFGVATRFTGLRGAYGLLYFVCLYYLLFDRDAVSSALAYLRRRFPGRSQPRLLGDTYRLFVSQGKCLVDRYAALAGLPFAFEFHGMEQFNAAAASQGFILLLAHVGNWQLALTALRNMGRPVCLLMRPEDSPAVADYLRVSSSGAELRIVDPEAPFGGVIELLRYVSEGWVVCMMGDRGYHFPATPVRFLGGNARFPFSAFRIAAAAGCPVLFFFAWRAGLGRYTIEAPLVCRPAYRVGEDRPRRLREWTQAFATAVESFAVAHPYQVFLFQDVWTPAGTLDDHGTPSARTGRSRRIEIEHEGLAGGNAS
jgi:predicted LPLAT superfamily acyltransferase